jgi:hypothetical protein
MVLQKGHGIGQIPFCLVLGSWTRWSVLVPEMPCIGVSQIGPLLSAIIYWKMNRLIKIRMKLVLKSFFENFNRGMGINCWTVWTGTSLVVPVVLMADTSELRNFQTVIPSSLLQLQRISSAFLHAVVDKGGSFLSVNGGNYDRSSDGRAFWESEFGRQFSKIELNLPNPRPLPVHSSLFFLGGGGKMMKYVGCIQISWAPPPKGAQVCWP